ncbi:hypothetical protein [Brumimicrobium mesophilum]|uniref:hypothetical protein n=1 Tax=Brumimicrobium mesophilum TaxID=392717 RepID=UPI000D144566|nr:hypothetical protein [Brumimicrobium mesophilum]
MKIIFLITLFLFSFLDFSVCQTTDLFNINIKFVDESNSPIHGLPVSISYTGAPSSMYHVTNEKGLINVNISILNPFSPDTLFGCYVGVVYNDYEFLSETLTIAKDTLKEDFTKIYKMQKMQPVELDEEQFNNLTGIISLEDFVKKDTLFLYQSFMMPAPIPMALGFNSIELIKLSKNTFKLDLYSSESSYAKHRVEKLIQVNLKKSKVIIEIDGVKFKFLLQTLQSQTQYGYTYRYMLIRM